MRRDLRHADRQAGLAAALLDASLPAPAGLLGRDGGPVERRLAVHRATTTLGLIGALASRHPVLERLLGAETFADLARAFLRIDRPPTALLLGWGDGLAAFVDAHPDLAEWPWLGDVARLEAAWARAHHAAEADPLGRAALTGFDPETLAASGVGLHPSLSTLASAHPVAAIWAAGGDVGAIDEAAGAEHLLILRPDAEVIVHRSSAAGLAFVTALAGGATIGAAAEAAVAVDPTFDAGAHLLGLVDLGAVVTLAPIGAAEENRS